MNPRHLKPRERGLLQQWWHALRHPSRQPADKNLVWLTAAILVVGLVVLYSASSVYGFQAYGDSAYFLKHQLLTGVLPGLAVMWVASRTPFSLWQRLAVPLFLVSLGLLVLTFVPGVGVTVRNVRSWLSVGGVTFQPSELAKLGLVLYLASWLERRYGRDLGDVAKGLAPFLVMASVLGALLVLQPDIGTLAVVACVAVGMFFLGGARRLHLAFIALAGVGCLVALVQLAPYRAQRLTTFLHPELDPRGIGYHINQSLLAIGSGGWWGRGLGQSVQKYNYLPEVHGDSVFAVMAEELGFLLTAAFLAMLLVWLLRVGRLAARAPTRFGQLVGGGVMLWVGSQSLLNVGGMLSLVPLTGLPLPFVSSGGSALAVTLAATGVLLSLSREQPGAVGKR